MLARPRPLSPDVAQSRLLSSPEPAEASQEPGHVQQVPWQLLRALPVQALSARGLGALGALPAPVSVRSKARPGSHDQRPRAR